MASIAEPELAAAALRRFAERLNRPFDDLLDRLGNKSHRELELLLEQAGLAGPASAADLLCRRLIEQWAARGVVSLETVGLPPSSDGFDTVEQSATQVAALIELLDPSRWPCALAVGPTGAAAAAVGATAALVERIGRALVALAMRVPHLTLGLAVSADDWREYMANSTESFTRAALYECVIAWPEHVSAFHRAEQCDVVVERVDLQTAIPSGAGSFAAASETELPADSPADGAAKSAHEMFLFEMLQHTPDLAGLFQLNARPGLLFGGRPAEIDLACTGLRIAVEIDGYRHFTDADHYRRDRRKDFELQQAGYLVLRFLADDVTAQMENVLDTIRAAVRHRRETGYGAEGRR